MKNVKLIFALGLLVTLSCSKDNGKRSEAESAVLASSTFGSEADTASLGVVSSDGGYIGQNPTNNNGGADGGFIGQPGTGSTTTGTSSNTTTTSPPVNNPVPIDSGTSGSSSGSVASNGSASSPSAGTAPVSVPVPSGSASTSPSAGGSDSGFIGINPSSGGDAGSVGVGTVAGSNINTTVGSNSSTTGNTVVAPVPADSSSSSSSSNSAAVDSTPIISPISDSLGNVIGVPAQIGGNDSGLIPNSGTVANDQGNVSTNSGAVVVNNNSTNSNSGIGSVSVIAPVDVVSDLPNSGNVASIPVQNPPNNSSSTVSGADAGQTTPTNGGQVTGNDQGNIPNGGNTSVDIGTVNGNPSGSTNNAGPVVVPPVTPVPPMSNSNSLLSNLINQLIQQITNIITGQTGQGGNDQGSVSNGNTANNDHGNNGVGNGIDPQPPGNPPVNDGPGTSPGNPGNQQASNACQKCKCSCKDKKKHKHCKVHQAELEKKDEISVKFSRVCSMKRSASQNLFFEEAKNPILSIETLDPKAVQKSCGCSYASAVPMPISATKSASGLPMIKGHILLEAYSLKSVDLMKGRYIADAAYSIDKLKKDYASKYKNAEISIRVCDDKNLNGFCSDEGIAQTLSVQTLAYTSSKTPKQVVVDVWSGRHLTLSEDPEFCEKQYSPIVLDLTGAGITLSGPDDSGVKFDLDASGQKEYTGWVNSSTVGFLVHDNNRNRQIEDGSELFGNATLMSNGKKAPNGFEAMKDFDMNKDGFLNPKDSVWRELAVWIDRNADGIAQRGELKSLNDLEITSFNLNYIEMMEIDTYGNQTRERSTYNRIIDGKEKSLLVIDVWFNTLVNLNYAGN